MRSSSAVVLCFLLVLPWCGSTILAAGETVSYQVGGETVRAYLTHPPNSFGMPGIVLIHEMWGLNEQIMGVADSLSRLGYVVIAPDLFRGKLGADPGLAQDMMRALNEDRAVAIVTGAIAFLRHLDRASGRPIATVGFGMGGRISLAMALRGADVQSTVIFYGGVETAREALAPIKAPLLGIFGGNDRTVPVGDVKKFEAALKETGKDATIIIHEGAGHDFFNDARPDYEPEMSKGAWVQMRDWLAVKLPQALPTGRALGRPPTTPAVPAPTP